MQQKICLILSLTVFFCYDNSSAVNLGSLEYDNLDTDLKDLAYEVDEEELNDYSKLIGPSEGNKKGKSSKGKKTSAKTSVKSSGFKNKKAENKGVETKYDIEDIKKFFKTGGLHDQGAHNDAELYSIAKGIAAGGVGVGGTETKKYRQGTKTRGFHRVHHKDEYKKDKEFYEDDETKSDVSKIGGKILGIKFDAGAGFDNGHFHHDRQKGIFGKEGSLDKGYFDKEFSEFSNSQGLDESFKSDS